MSGTEVPGVNDDGVAVLLQDPGEPLGPLPVTLSRPTITAALGRLGEIGIVREITGRRRDRLFVYTQYVDTLNEATEPLPR